MGKAFVSYDEVRFVMLPDFTEVYILCNCSGDYPIQAQGWGYKVFSKELSVLDIISAWATGKNKDGTEFESPLLWPKKAP